jgi:broad specificity phosphatase PhoE
MPTCRHTRELILIRHSLPEIVPDVPARQWTLSEEGRLRCRWLAQRLAETNPGVIVTSLEPKAIETGQVVASLLNKPFETATGLHEHERRRVGFATQRQFEARVAALFEQPDELVMGTETATQAQRRFMQAVNHAIARHPRGNVAIVAHGTVIALFTAQAAGVDPFVFWKRLGLPAFVVFSLPSMELIAVVERIEIQRN